MIESPEKPIARACAPATTPKTSEGPKFGFVLPASPKDVSVEVVWSVGVPPNVYCVYVVVFGTEDENVTDTAPVE